MPSEWAAERTLSSGEAAALIDEQFSELAPARHELLGEGWDNSAYLVNSSYVFRFPRRQISADLIDIEAAVLPAIAPQLPLRVPAPLFVGRPARDFPWPFSGYALIPGRTLCVANLDDVQQAALAAPLGRFLAALHAIAPAEAERRGAPADRLGRLNLARRVPRALTTIEELAARGLLQDGGQLADCLRAGPTEYVPRTDTLVHGDLYARHLVVDYDGALAGVIDWGDVHLGDAAIDLSIAHLVLPPAAHETFRAAYGPIDELSWRVARLRSIWHTLYVLPYATEREDAALLRACRRALSWLAVATV